MNGQLAVLLVEQSPHLRSGGYVIDFWGVGYDIAERTGLLTRIRELGYQVEEVRFVDRHGRRRGGFSTDVFTRMTGGRFTSLRRSDLAATIYRALDGIETIFRRFRREDRPTRRHRYPRLRVLATRGTPVIAPNALL